MMRICDDEGVLQPDLVRAAEQSPDDPFADSGRIWLAILWLVDAFITMRQRP